jgi:hypothetical protein
VHESSKSVKKILGKDEAGKINAFGSEVVAKDATLTNGLQTPQSTSTPILLEGKKRSRNSSAFKNTFQTPSMSARVEGAKTQSTSSKRRKRSWTSLKEIAQSKHDNSQVASLTIPFFL